jgi:NADPH:quinone reductase-like Zn-dependent oxidoreductase
VLLHERRKPMFAIYATHAAPDDPLSALKIGDLPEPSVPDGWVRVKVSHASLNRHDLFTLQGISAPSIEVAFPRARQRGFNDQPAMAVEGC